MRSGEESSVEGQEDWILVSGTAKQGPVPLAVIVPICTVLNKALSLHLFHLGYFVGMCTCMHMCCKAYGSSPHSSLLAQALAECQPTRVSVHTLLGEGSARSRGLNPGCPSELLTKLLKS